jgi:hypothetical protein
MKPVKTQTIHYFRVERLPEWPDLPWPSWKPDTKKMMRPELVTFNISIEDGVEDVSTPHVTGPRILGTGALGVPVDDTYYSYTKNVPLFITNLVDDAKRCIKGT